MQLATYNNTASRITFFPICAVVGGWIHAEICGYFLHILLYSDKIPYLSRNHMIHHMRIYGPERSLRSEGVYLSATEGRVGCSEQGMKWLGPIAVDGSCHFPDL